ncbi:endonuclease/exonuclease/phosphatase family protein [Hymenobacter defluvii]|uniref:Endonuclease/exonuclease/phosphatase family protein n=1 Tax=Hymenobacter defluvii TaxID=2054411 RepID=A0ABS3TCH7_9BACT|nr:endonuclease/exonuclease/phosphatase family protein [Hymenobacter defluvii]MBO3270465.1 endonuclease/exonuclease/phosphatase family protein [Hymenobacter defluvii]
MKNLFSCLLPLLLACSATKSADPTPTPLAPAPVAPAPTLRVMSYNVHHCSPPSRPGVIDLPAIARTIEAQHPDVVMLQEIDVHTGRSGTGSHQARELAEQLHMHAYFGRAIPHDGGAYGVALLSRYPLQDTIVHRLPTQDGTNGEPRVLAAATISLPSGQKIRVGCTHFDAQRTDQNRQLQAAELVRLAQAEKLPFVVAGDFNAEASSPVMQQVVTALKPTCQSCAPTIPVVTPTKAIDFITFAPQARFQVVSHQVVAETYASDHRPVVAELRYSK